VGVDAEARLWDGGAASLAQDRHSIRGVEPGCDAKQMLLLWLLLCRPTRARAFVAVRNRNGAPRGGAGERPQLHEQVRF